MFHWPLAIFNFPLFHFFLLVHIFGGVFNTFLNFDPVWPLIPLPLCTYPIFLSDLASYTLCHTQFFTPSSPSAPFFSVMLISFILLASLPAFSCAFGYKSLPLHVVTTYLSPLKKSLTFRHVGLYFFFHFFALFPALDVESIPLLFT